MNAKPVCRRCSECPNSRHHWMDCCEEIETAEGTVIFDRICKHCELLGTDCEACGGDGCMDTGGVTPQGQFINDHCPACDGYGVVESCMYGREDEDE